MKNAKKIVMFSLLLLVGCDSRSQGKMSHAFVQQLSTASNPSAGTATLVTKAALSATSSQAAATEFHTGRAPSVSTAPARPSISSTQASTPAGMTWLAGTTCTPGSAGTSSGWCRATLATNKQCVQGDTIVCAQGHALVRMGTSTCNDGNWKSDCIQPRCRETRNRIGSVSALQTAHPSNYFTCSARSVFRRTPEHRELSPPPRSRSRQ